MQITSQVFDRTQRIYLVRVRGDVQPADIHQVTGCLNAVLENKARHIIVVFEGCASVSAYFLRVLFSLFFFIARSRGNFIIVNSDPRLNERLAAFGLAGVIDIVPGEAAAAAMVYRSADQSRADLKVKTAILDRVERSIREEDARRRDGPPPAAAPRKDETATIVAEPGDDIFGATFMQDVRDFNATIEMSLDEMGLAPPPAAADRPLTAELADIGGGSHLSTAENAVQFLDIRNLSLDKDSDFEREIQEKSDRHFKEAPLAPAAQRTAPEPADISRLFLPARDQVALSAPPPCGYHPVGRNRPFHDLVMLHLPECPPVAAVRRLLPLVQERQRRGDDIVLCVDEGVLAAGLTGWMIRLVRERCVTGVIVSLLAAMKDVEAAAGIAPRALKVEAFQGAFGVSAETFGLFGDIVGRPVKGVADGLREVMAGRTWPHPDHSLLWNCHQHECWTVIPTVESSPLLYQFGVIPGREETLHRIVTLFSQGRQPLVIFPGCGPATLSFFVDIMRIRANKKMGGTQAAAAYFAGRVSEDFREVLSGAGLAVECVEGDPGVLFPLFAECLLDRSGQ
ncbi:MAG: STAS domain-containing protein [Planctomycetota bacterium]